MGSALAAGGSGGDGDDPNDRGKAIDEHRLDATDASMRAAAAAEAYDEAWWKFHERFPFDCMHPEQGDPEEWPASEDDEWYVNNDDVVTLHPDDVDLASGPLSWQESIENDTAFCATYGRAEDGLDLPESEEIHR